MSRLYPKSKVEVQGFEARHYDKLMDIITMGKYAKFIETAIENIGIKKQDKILDLGAGTGRNALLMHKFLDKNGKITCLELSDLMIAQIQQKISHIPNIEVKKQRIDLKLSYENEYDKVFISFVLHGLPHSQRKEVIRNAFRALKPGGEFIILDYNNLEDTKISPFHIFLIKILECPYAYEFMGKNWKEIPKDFGFEFLSSHTYFHNVIRLLKMRKADK